MDTEVFGVITGDVVNSGNLKGYGESLDEAVSLFEADFRSSLALGVDRYSGDRFQALLDDPGDSLRGALYLFTRLASLERPVPVRISIGIGEVDRVPDGRTSKGEGEAFRLSGSGLDEMERYQRVGFEASEQVLMREENDLMGGSMDLLSALLLDLSSVQAEVVWYKLKGMTQEEIARKTGRKQQSVSDILIAGYWRNLRGFLGVFEKRFSPDVFTGN